MIIRALELVHSGYVLTHCVYIRVIDYEYSWNGLGLPVGAQNGVRYESFKSRAISVIFLR